MVASFRALDRVWTDQPVDILAERWRRSVEIAEALGARVRQVRYEVLATDPEGVLPPLFTWLGAP